MLELEIPGWKTLRIAHLVLDLNGTLTEDGVLIEGVTERLERLAGDISIHIVSADTRGDAAAIAQDLPADLIPVPAKNQEAAKGDIVRRIDKSCCAAIGNGHVDTMMLAQSCLGLAVIQKEGASPAAIGAADAVFTDIRDALDFLLLPSRMVATLRR